MQESDMELLLLSSLLMLSIFISLALRTLYSKPKTTNLPPGRTGWPVVGEALEFLSAGWKGAPEKFFQDRMIKYSQNIFITSFIGEKTAVFCGPAGNRFLFSNNDKLVTTWWPKNVEKIFPTSLDTSTKEEAIRMRKLLPGFLKPEALLKFVPLMDSVAKQHLCSSNWNPKNGEITVLPLLREYTFAVACRLFLSIDDPEHIEKFFRPFRVLLKGIFSVPINLPGTPLNRAIKATKVLRKEFLEIINQRKIKLMEGKSIEQDILTHMLSTSDENGKFLSELNIADKIIGLLIGGHDTASIAITFIMKYLAELPEVYYRVLEEMRGVADGKPPGELLNWEDLKKMKYSWNVACEVLRLAPPLQGNFREALTDFTYAGFSIPKGWKVYWTVNSTHKNPEYFHEPEKFDPTRFDDKGPIPYTFVPFGGGPGMCPGKEYARVEILAFIYNVVRKFKWEKVILDEKVVVDPLPMPANGLPIRLYYQI